MKLKVFTGLLLGVVVVLFYAVFTNHYYHEKERTASAIIESIDGSIIDLSFIMSQNNAKDVKHSKTLIDRKLATNNYLKAITVFDKATPIIYTNFKYMHRPVSSIDIVKIKNYNQLIGANNIETKIVYYDNWDKKTYTIVYTLNKKYIQSYFSQNKIEYILLFLVFPGILIFITSSLFIKYIFNPLHTLREYTTTDGVCIPPKFKILELETLRGSTVEAFELLKKEKRELFKLSRTDSLTGLDNRASLEEKINIIIDDKDSKRTEFALLFLDIDHFKSINDSLGHKTGDELLVKLAKIMQASLTEDDIVARIGGDEFIIVLNSYHTDEKLERIINNITQSANTQIVIDGIDMNITVSIGISICPTDDNNLSGLMQKADIALFKAKELGRNQHVYFTNQMFDETQRLIALNKDMLSALLNKEYTLHYQPQVDINSNKIIGAEALIRWQKDDGFVSPNEFIPVAEKSGFIIDLGWWIITTALKDKLVWEEKGLDISMSINIAAKQFSDPNFYDNFKFYLDRFRVDRSQITLEITEYIFMYSDKSLLETFKKIKALGVSISLDDFGTGYSSLSYLKKFPIDVIKIDKTFIDDYNSVDGKVFLDTIIKMAESLHLDLVAEGVEEQEQLDFLYERKCDKYQGYLCSKPLPPKDFIEFVENKV